MSTEPGRREALKIVDSWASWIEDVSADMDAPGDRNKFRRDHEHVRRALSEPAAPPWQPIETAPKDGTSVLVRQADVLEPSMTVCAFDPCWGADGWWMCCDGKNTEIPLRGPEPAHWMRLPDPPEEA